MTIYPTTAEAKDILRNAGFVDLVARADLFDQELGDNFTPLKSFLFRSPQDLINLLGRVVKNPAKVADKIITLTRGLSTHQSLKLEATILRAIVPRTAIVTVPQEALFQPIERTLILSIETDNVSVPQVNLRQNPGHTMDYKGYLCLILKVTRLCNLRCVYCHDWSVDHQTNVSIDLLIRLVSQALNSRRGVLDLILHGGEPLMMGRKRFLKMIYLLTWFSRPNQIVRIHMQSNATLINSRWLRILKLFDIHVSVSIDGSPEIHDTVRPDVLGRPTWKRTLQGLRNLDAAGLFSGAIVVVSQKILDLGADRLLLFLCQEKIRTVSLLAERPSAESPMSVTQTEYVNFLIDFERSRRASPKESIAVREIDAIKNLLDKKSSGFCELAGNCVGHFITVDANGDVSHCDKYVGDPSYVLGNLNNQSLDEILQSKAIQRIREKTEKLEVPQGWCPYRDLCKGWCPHERYVAYNSGLLDPKCCGLAPLFEEMNRTNPHANKVMSI